MRENYGPHQLEVSAAGLKGKSPARELEVAWPSVSQIVRDGERLYVCFPPNAFVINRATYQGPVEFDQLAPALERLRATK